MNNDYPKILFASNNRGKYDELADDFKAVGLDLVFYSDLDLPKLELPEDYDTLIENAREKAAVAAKNTGYYTLGDDSGIFITSIDYTPGVHSRRWSCSEGDDAGRCKKILDLMKDEKDRSVYLISRFSLANDSGEEIFRTVVKNEFAVSKEIKGEHGFGYDSILIPSQFNIWNSSLPDNRKWEIAVNKCTIGELTQEEKNAINDRGRIAKEIKIFLDNYNKNNNKLEEEI